jgi:hypothetical protein
VIEPLAADVFVTGKKLAGICELVGRVDRGRPAIAHYSAPGLSLSGRVGLNLRIFGHLRDKCRDLGPEGLRDLLARQGRVLDCVMEQGGSDNRLVKPLVPQQLRDGDWMVDLGVTVPESAMGGARHPKGAFG